MDEERTQQEEGEGKRPWHPPVLVCLDVSETRSSGSKSEPEGGGYRS